MFNHDSGMRRAVIAGVLGALSVFPPAATAESGDSTLRYYLANSEMAVSGKITSEPICISSEATEKYFTDNHEQMVNYNCREFMRLEFGYKPTGSGPDGSRGSHYR